MASNARTTPRELPVDPASLARFGRLELLARLVVEGVMAGLHKSPFKGVSVEFAEHRQYGPGDEIRHIDWRAYGKTDRYYVKEYEEETNLRAHLVVDCSGSMAYAGGTPSKFERARQLAASIAYMMINQRDAVGLARFDATLRTVIPPRSAPGHFAVICQALEASSPRGEAPLSRTLHALAERIERRGLVVILSDGFDRLDDLVSALRHLRHRKHEVLFLHVVAPEEESFPFRRTTQFRGLEDAARPLRVDPAAVRAAYLQRFRAHCEGLADQLRGMNADYHRASTSQSPESVLIDYLATRSGHGRGRSRDR
jgi:uncharacterized protein (DUF58 family)